MIHDGIRYRDVPYYEFTGEKTIRLRDLTDLDKPVQEIHTHDYVAFYSVNQENNYDRPLSLLQVDNDFYAPPHAAWNLSVGNSRFSSYFTDSSLQKIVNRILEDIVINAGEFLIDSSEGKVVIMHSKYHDLVLAADHVDLVMPLHGHEVKWEWEKEIYDSNYYMFLSDDELVGKRARKDPRINSYKDNL